MKTFTFLLAVCIAAVSCAGVIHAQSTSSMLSIQSFGEGAMISWPLSPPGFVLQTNTSLSADGWQNMIYPSPVIGITNQSVILTSLPTEMVFFRLKANGEAPFVSPTNVEGIVADFDAAPLTTYQLPMNTFTDLVGGVIASSPMSDIQPTNYIDGIWLGGAATPCSFTNEPIMMNSNFTVEVIFRLCPTNIPVKASLSSAFVECSVIDNQPRMLVGNNNFGLGISNGIVFGNWGNGYNFSSANYWTTNMYRPNYDIIDSAGVLYTNGVACGQGVGLPTTNFYFNEIGSMDTNYNASGYLMAFRLWDGPLSASVISNIYVWNLTNGATDVTNGLAMRWKLNENSGTNIFDSAGSNNATFVSGAPIWTNGLDFINNDFTNSALFLQSNYVLSATSSNILNGWSNCTLTFWYCSTQSDLINDPSDANPEVLLSKFNLSSEAAGGFSAGPGIWIFNEEFEGIIDMSCYVAQDGNNYNEATWNFPNDGLWHFVVCEISNSIPFQCVDGMNQTFPNLSPNSLGLYGKVRSWSNASGWSMGNDVTGVNWSVSNCLDDVCFYTNLLTQKQIAQKLQKGPQ